MELPKVIAIEEHFWTQQMQEATPAGTMPPHWAKHLSDVGAGRLAEMDRTGITMQVLSHAPPPIQLSPGLARDTNDELARIVASNPSHFAAFAILPMQDPAAAVAELERTVKTLNFCGAMIHGLTDLTFMDDKRFWPILECAQALDVPIYLHPANPHPAVAEAYYKGYMGLSQAGWGFMAETANHAIRLILSGVFDTLPRLKIVLGHLGEGLPFTLRRTNAALSRNANLKRPFIEYFRDHFYITTSGNFSNAALLCSLMEISADRILFAADWPFAGCEEAINFMKAAPISPLDRDKILHRNAEALLRI